MVVTLHILRQMLVVTEVKVDDCNTPQLQKDISCNRQKSRILTNCNRQKSMILRPHI